MRHALVAWWPTLIILAVAAFTDLRSRRLKCTTNVAHPWHETGIAIDVSNSRAYMGLFVNASDLFFGWKQRGMCCDAESALANPMKRKMPYAPALAIGTPISFFAR
jgi:prepilin signal peptidase PulO-like enzyme (type II secretory pathway)